jgi:hypothetical protein
MKRFVLSVLVLILATAHAPAQNGQTDQEFDGLKGRVKSAVTERADLKKSGAKLVESKRRPESAFTYDQTGSRLTWKSYDYLSGTLFESVVYRRVDGEKVSIYEEVAGSNKITGKIAGTDTPAKADPRAMNYRKLTCY